MIAWRETPMAFAKAVCPPQRAMARLSAALAVMGGEYLPFVRIDKCREIFRLPFAQVALTYAEPTERATEMKRLLQTWWSEPYGVGLANIAADILGLALLAAVVIFWAACT